MAGFNEVDLLLCYLIAGSEPETPTIKPGWYLRSLAEQYITEDRLR